MCGPECDGVQALARSVVIGPHPRTPYEQQPGAHDMPEHNDSTESQRKGDDMISTGDLKKGISLEMDGQLYTIVDWQHIKMGRGGAIVRIKLRNLRSGSIIEKTFDAGERFQRAFLERRPVQYSYNDGDTYYFMDNETYETFPLTAEQLGDAKDYLLDGMRLEIVTYNDEPLNLELPGTVDLEVTYTEPGFKGDTATGGTKPATLQTGKVVQVPLFVTTGDKIRVKTDTGTYVERVG
jgi:elongation factor P